jgi:hypothetical protein
MRKNFLLTVATTVTAFFVGTIVAQAASVQWGGQLRPRFEVNERHDFNDDTSSDYFVSSRIRLHAKADILPDTSAFVQLQSTRTWGNNLGGSGSNVGSGNASFTANDGDASVGVHQAYFTLKNFAGIPADLKVGRQEVVLDGHRLLGNTGWTQGAQTHDAVRLTHHQGNHTMALVYARANDGGTGAAADPTDVDVYVAYANFQGILGGGLSLYYIFMDDECGLSSANACTAGPSDNNIHTVGARQAGQLFGLDYRGEFYYQYGGAEATASTTGGPYAVTGPGSGVDRSAYMYGLRVGKKFNNVMWKPSLTLWYDYLSGTSDQDARNGDFKTFNTLFDTGHKFYGFMDLFLPNNGGNTNFLGLIDYAVKTSISPAKNWKLKADFHHFEVAEGASANTTLGGTTGGAAHENNLGNEIDLTLVHKYNANTTISAGYSYFDGTNLFDITGGGGATPAGDDAQWAYLQFDVKF